MADTKRTTPCTHTNSYWAGLTTLCTLCGAVNQAERDRRDEARSISTERYWQDKQGDEYGSY